jgi:tetratricopeptide (TPR) repeat protein
VGEGAAEKTAAVISAGRWQQYIFGTMRTTLIISIGLLLGTNVHGQDYYERFKKFLTDKDTVGQRTLLQEWDKMNNNDPELYTCYFNYYVQKSISEIVRLDNNPGTGENLQITDSTKQVVGYIYGETSYNAKYLNLGFNIIDKGINKFPDRLDMRFGKIHMLEQVNYYDSFTVEIVKAIDYSTKNKNKWLWTSNESVKHPKEFLLDNVQTYINSLFGLDDEQAKNIRRIAETTLKNYPDHVISLSNLGVSYIFENNYKKALDPLLKAEKMSPEDVIILGNIAFVYEGLEDSKKVIEYYEKIAQFGNDNDKSFAEEKLKTLRK